MRAALPYVAIAALAFGIDQTVKAWVELRLPFQEPVELLPFLALYRTFNTGVAFSMFAGWGGVPLAVLSVLVVGFVLWLAARTEKGQVWARTGFALVIGGALGNLADRVLLGHVIDYVLFHTPIWSFAVFNLADAFITVGAGLVILEEFLAWRRQRRLPAAEQKAGEK